MKTELNGGPNKIATSFFDDTTYSTVNVCNVVCASERNWSG